MLTEERDDHGPADSPAAPPRRGLHSPLWRAAFSITVIVVLMLWILGACRKGVIPARNASGAGESAAGLATATLALQSLPSATEAVGTVQPEQIASVMSRVVANLVELRASAGQHVASGAVLAMLDDRDLRHRVEQAQDAARSAEATLAQAKADYARDKPLADQKVITPYDFEHTKTALDVADANLHRLQQAEREAEVALSYAAIRSPFTGTIVDKLANVGDLAAPGRPLLTMYEQGRLWFAANVPEDLLARIRLGDAMTFRIDAFDGDRQGRVVEIVPASDPASRTVVVRLHMTDTSGVVPGMFGRLRIPTEPQTVLVVPASAVTRAGQLTMVDVARDGRLERRTVQLGRQVAGGFEVLSGLAAGDAVVLRGGTGTPDGRAVR
jgi:membrane fusion protein (multidrug efflux system)